MKNQEYCNRPYLFVCLFVGPPYYSLRAVLGVASERFLILLCFIEFLCVLYVYMYCDTGRAAWNKLDDDDDDEVSWW